MPTVPLSLTLTGRWQGRGRSRTLRRYLRVAPPIGVPAVLAVTDSILHDLPAPLPADLPDGDEFCRRAFGLSSHQATNRILRRHHVWAVHRGRRSGVWWCVDLALRQTLVRPRSSVYRPCGRVPAEYHWLVEPMLQRGWERELDWSVLDCGPDRLPPVWECNLCGYAAELRCWPRKIGLLGDYISGCPKCGGQGLELFRQIAENTRPEFRPFERWQDDYLFSL